ALLSDFTLEVKQRGWVLEARFPQKVQMACDLESARFVIPIRSIGFDKVAIYEDTAFGQSLEAAPIHVRDRLLAAEVVQSPGGNNGLWRTGETCRPELVHEVGFGQGYPLAQFA